MMRFRDTPQNKLIAASITECTREYDLVVLRADQRSYYEELWENVKAYMDACSMGIAVFDQMDDDDINPNVSLELGYMIARQRTLLLLKEKRIKSLPTDICGRLYREFDCFHIESTVRSATYRWLRDVGIAKALDEKLVVFMSYGGTCRCAMAKIILRRALEGRKLPFRMRVESIARWYGSGESASNSARKAILDYYGEDLLSDHRVTRICAGHLRDADLILAMDRDLVEGVQDEYRDKMHLLTKFFMDTDGDIIDPWPDNDPEAPVRYKACLEEIRAAIEPNVDRLVSFLAV